MDSALTVSTRRMSLEGQPCGAICDVVLSLFQCGLIVLNSRISARHLNSCHEAIHVSPDMRLWIGDAR